MGLLVSLGYNNKTPQTGRLKQQNFISHSSGVWKTKSKVLADLVSPEAFLLGWQLAIFSLYLHMTFLSVL